MISDFIFNLDENEFLIVDKKLEHLQKPDLARTALSDRRILGSSFILASYSFIGLAKLFFRQ